MQPVTQKHPMSCGIACVSFVSNKDYDQIASEQDMIKLEQTGFYCPELTAMLNRSGYSYSWKKLNENIQHEFSAGDIVFIKRDKNYPGGHFLVKSEEGWMDPWINFQYGVSDIKAANSGFREELPGTPEYLIYETNGP